MGMFSSLQDVFGFTRNEIKVILFLALTFLAGLCIRWYRSASPPARHLDYSLQDSIFIRRSASLLSDDGKGKGPSTGSSERDRSHNVLRPGSLDLNNATRDELIMLPGIGATYAGRILAYRKSHGPFRSLQDLENVKGIGKKTVERISEFVDVSKLSGPGRSP